MKSDDVRQVWDLILAPKVMSRPYLLPPGVPAERVAALRTAFERLAQDPAFLAEMDRTKTEVSYLSGVESERDQPGLCFSAGDRRQDGRRYFEQGEGPG